MPGPYPSFVEDLRLSHSEAQVQGIGLATETVPAEIGRMHNVAVDRKAVHAQRLRHVGEMPLMLTDAWVAERIGAGLTLAAL
ncbi:hypothetical protein H6CHR_04014 [Variovorax sp. PBL-H6]|uniref:hypothetical protein n=1 Tax=Variovorax sp. PBL-H6 TaxID=434009 RepID=UPI0013180896|nr:hypothetical protein [Variovorax sp. PBL-H6]VTU33502.1 hypothetical protein H6CHR_04014 [Variovorax sp. PBL-H6]